MFSKKHSFFVLKKKYFVFAACFLLVVASVIVYFTAIRPTFRPNTQKVIVIDAGHGGKDGGAVGRQTGISESELNLQYSLALKSVCEQFGYKVVLTRDSMAGLYSPLASNKKRSEMAKREAIIKKSNPDIVVSIHMNSFPSAEAHGAQVYYAQGSQSGQELADNVSLSLNKNIANAKLTSKAGDFYVLNVSPAPSILVECGFLSNPEEELLLQKEDYRNEFCYHLFCGILQFQKYWQ